MQATRKISPDVRGRRRAESRCEPAAIAAALVLTLSWVVPAGAARADQAQCALFVPCPLPPPPDVAPAAIANANKTAVPAALVIDEHDNLLDLFIEQETDEELSSAATQTLPLLTGATVFATQDAMNGIQQVVQARMETNQGLSSGEGFLGNQRFWLKPFASFGRQAGRSGVSGYEIGGSGFAFGMDGTPSETLRLGGALAYARAVVEGSSNTAPQDADVHVYQVIGYGSYTLPAGSELSLQLDLGKNITKGKRQIEFTSSKALSEYDSYSAHIGIGFGRSSGIGSQTTFTPSLRIDYSTIRDKAYREHGADLLDLSVDRRSTSNLLFGFDGRVAHHVTERATVFAALGLCLDAVNDRATTVSSFAGAPGAEFRTQGIRPNPWVSRAGFGALYETPTGFELTARYDAEARQSFLNHTVSVKLRWPF